MKTKKTVFLTGASGNMGLEGFKQLLARRDRFDITALVLPTAKDKKIMSPYVHESGVNIVWGDLTNYSDVLKCVTGADYVLHVGGMVSPKADYQPELTTKINIGAIRNILRAIQSQPDPDAIRLVYIGTVAQTGDRNPPVHWGRAGDPICISIYDNYALTKTIAEREVIESGLKYWVSLRQSGMLYPDILNSMDPIMFHQSLHGVFEWVSSVDSGRLLANVCEADVPEKFWRRIYNIGGGTGFRLTNLEFIEKTLSALGIKDFRKVMDANWFATQNFHGQWFEDSDVLENYLHFRRASVDDFLDALKRNSPVISRLARFVPSFIIRKYFMEPIANKEMGTMYWIKNNIQDRIAAFFGSKEKWQQIPSWGDLKIERPSSIPMRLNHGYDESKVELELSIADMKQVAVFRGGSCLSNTMVSGDLYTKLEWRCASGHEFSASPALILLGGHWCPNCLPPPWDYDEEARRNPFFAQVWVPKNKPSS